MTLNNAGRLTPRFDSRRWQDWVNLILAIWLFISPWVLSFGANVTAPAGGAVAPNAAGAASTASWDAWVLGVIIFFVAGSAISRLELWQEWVNLLLGIWLFIAPWVLGFTGLANAAWDHWVVGVLVFVFAVWDLSTMRRRSAGVTVQESYAGKRPDVRP